MFKKRRHLEPESELLRKLFEIKPKMEDVFFVSFFKNRPNDLQLNKTHTRTIMALFYMGAVPMSEISQKLGLEKGSFTPVAKKLISIGLVQKTKSEEDGRISLLSLTDEGENFANNLRVDHHTHMQSQLDQLTGEEQKKFDEAIGTVLNMLDKIDTN